MGVCTHCGPAVTARVIDFNEWVRRPENFKKPVCIRDRVDVTTAAGPAASGKNRERRRPEPLKAERVRAF